MWTHPIVENLIASILIAGSGYMAKVIIDKVGRWRNRRLISDVWHVLEGPIALSISIEDEVAALADFQALTYIAGELSNKSDKVRIYTGKIDLKQISDHILVMGGPKNNQLFNSIANDIGLPFRFYQEPGYVIRDHKNGRTFRPVFDEVSGTLCEDVGLYVRARNPYYEDKYVVMAAGCHTQGTIAAMQFATKKETLQHIADSLDSNVEVIVRCKVRNQTVTDVSLDSTVIKF